MQEAESIPEAAFRDSKLVFCKGSKVYKLALRLKTLPKRYFQVRCQITCGRAWAGIATHWLAQPGHMGFKADADQGTGNEQAGQTKLQNRAPLPVEKQEKNQQSAMEVIGQVFWPYADLY